MRHGLRMLGIGVIGCALFHLSLMAAGGLLHTSAAPESSATANETTPLICLFTETPLTADGRIVEPAWGVAGREQSRKANTEPTRAPALRFLWNHADLFFAMDITESAKALRTLWLKPSAEHTGLWRVDLDGQHGARIAFIADEKSEPRFLPAVPGMPIELNVSNRAAPVKSHRDIVFLEGRLPWIALSATGGRAVVGETWRVALTTSDAPNSVQRPSNGEFRDLTFSEALSELERPHGIAARVPLTTSRVVGSPDTPPPYRAVRTLENLKVSWPVFAITEPGTRKLIYIDQPGPYGQTRICRTTGELAEGKFETLLDADYAAFSICFHPQFAENGYMYVGNNGGSPKQTRVTRYTLQRDPPFDIVAGSERIIIQWPSDGHNGAAVDFGPDGMLYVTSGDGTSDSDTNVMGQGLDHLLSKLLRIDVDHTSETETYSVPADNPFVDMPGVRPETWAYGFRNPWRLSIDQRTGNIWVGNNGQDLWEQIFLVERGANYGWSVYEGSHPFYLNRQLGPHAHTPPTFEHSHSEARSLTGGIVYYGKKFPELFGAYLYGDYSTGKIWGAKVVDGNVIWHRELADTTLQITAFASDPDGELLIADHHQDSGFYTLQINDRAHDPEAFPKLLSQTGLFQSVEGHVVQPALIPYTVNSPLWSDGADKSRFIALPESAGKDGAPPKIQFTSRGPWVFPDGTVLVKSFALEQREGDPSSKRWIETRLLTRQEGEWVGYSYLWNDQQTDATLVESSGRDVTYEVETPSGMRQQTWHYPSRTECMVCHSRAANFVLGISTMQMNRDHDYGEVTDNQIRAIEHLGLFEFDARLGALEELQAAWNNQHVADEMRAVYTQALEPMRDQRLAGSGSRLWKHPEQFTRLVDPYDDDAPLALRARSYLHANCAQCHVMAGGGNAQMDLDYNTSLAKAGLVDVRPLHHTFGIEDARIVAPGDPGRSVLLERLTRRGEGQMPQLATTRVDEQAVEMLRQWIESL